MLLAPGAAPAPVFLPRAQAEGLSPRIAIETPDLTGSVALKGARIDDLFLKNYHVTVDPKSPLVELFRPEGAQGAYFADTGWTGANVPGLPGPNTLWSAPAGAVLGPGSPVTLTYDNGQGLVFTRTLSVDANYMFTLTDQVANRGAQTVALAPYGSVQRQCHVADAQHKDPCLADGAIRSPVVHEGYIGWLGEQLQAEKNIAIGSRPTPSPCRPPAAGWSITDKYWMASLIPDQHQTVSPGTFRVTPTATSTVFKGRFRRTAAKRRAGRRMIARDDPPLCRRQDRAPAEKSYQAALGAPQLDQAVDWGSVLVPDPAPVLRGRVFLPACRQFRHRHPAADGVRAPGVLLAGQQELRVDVQDEERSSRRWLRSRRATRRTQAKQQAEMMALYKQEQINPFLGCVPMLLQIPVFYSLYKVLSVTIEMRHAPFFGWVHDLSARDPTTLMNLFGALPFDPGQVALLGAILGGPLHIGAWPLLYGATMWLSMSMAPQAGIDPTQQKIMQFMPLFLLFTISGVAVGLVIYWCWSNCLTILQQYVIMRRFKVDNPIDDIIAKLTRKKAPA